MTFEPITPVLLFFLLQNVEFGPHSARIDTGCCHQVCHAKQDWENMSREASGGSDIQNNCVSC